MEDKKKLKEEELEKVSGGVDLLGEEDYKELELPNTKPPEPDIPHIKPDYYD